MDKEIADVGRQLAAALQEYGYTRKPDDKKRVYELQTCLVRVVAKDAEDAEDAEEAKKAAEDAI